MFRRVIGRHKRRAGNNSRHVGVVDLPASVIALTPHRVADGVQNALLRTPCSSIKITRILLKEGWKNCTGEKRGRKRIPVGRAETLGVPLRALPELLVFISRLLKSGKKSDSANRNHVGR